LTYQNGILVHFLNDFHGVIDAFYLNKPMAAKEWVEAYPEGEVLEARIVYVDHGSKSVRLSMRPHVVELRAPANLPALGKLHIEQ
jgi:ribosomal protein S1